MCSCGKRRKAEGAGRARGADLDDVAPGTDEGPRLGACGDVGASDGDCVFVGVGHCGGGVGNPKLWFGSLVVVVVGREPE